MELFDCNICVGLPTRGASLAHCERDDVLNMMTGHGISKALVWHIAQHDSSPQTGNVLASETIANHPNLHGCWSILPPQTDEIITPHFFKEMHDNRIAALRTMPIRHYYMLNRVVFGKFLDEVTERRIPVLISLEYGADWPAVYTLMADFPNLHCIVCDIGVWSQTRYIFPLLEAYPNLKVETSLLSLTASGLEVGVSKYGAERFVFGSGYPARSAEAASLDLRHSELTEQQRSQIACGNMQKMIDEVQW